MDRIQLAIFDLLLVAFVIVFVPLALLLVASSTARDFLAERLRSTAAAERSRG